MRRVSIVLVVRGLKDDVGGDSERRMRIGGLINRWIEDGASTSLLLRRYNFSKQNLL